MYIYFIYLLIYLSIYLLIYLSIYLLIYLFTIKTLVWTTAARLEVCEVEYKIAGMLMSG